MSRDSGFKNHINVIILSRVLWKFFDYCEDDGNRSRNFIEDWRQALSEEAQEIFRTALKNDSKVESHIKWGLWKRYMKGALSAERIWELDFRADKLQHRILGVFGGRKQAIFLIGCYHKDRVYTPTAALDTALKRAKAVRGGRAKLHERPIEEDY